MGKLIIKEESIKYFDKDIFDILTKFESLSDNVIQKELHEAFKYGDLMLEYFSGEPRGLLHSTSFNFPGRKIIFLNDFWLGFVSGYRAK